MEEIFGLQVISTIVSGAEAYIYLVNFFGQKAILKYRKPKSYRNTTLDVKIRSERTLLEAKLIGRACLAGVNTPALFAVSRSNATILMEYINGVNLLGVDDKTLLTHVSTVASSMGVLHKNGIIHGDPTLANIIVSNNDVFFVDFGLGNFSYDIEQRAVDVNLFLKICQALKPSVYNDILGKFKEGYFEAIGQKQGEQVLERVKQIRMRGRYVEERREKY
ncbi:MAG: Kae1-associated kinase Bud32 [Thermoprotei archaeon]